MAKRCLTRADELREIVAKAGVEDAKTKQLIEELIFLEKGLDELKKLPFIKVNPNDPTKQKATPASRQYKELLSQYNNTLKLFLKIMGDLSGDEETESPLRAWVKARSESQ